MGKWRTCTIGDLGTVVGGATPSTKRVENYDGGTIAWITPKDLAGFSGRFIFCGERCITEQGLKSCSTQLVPAHTVLFSSRAPIGYIAIAGQDVCTNQGFKSVVPNESTDYMFLYYLLKYSKDKIENLGSGTTFKEISGSTMRGIEVFVPEAVEEQRRIASILSVLDDKIEKNIAVNENLLQQAIALYEWLLGKSDWPTATILDVAKKVAMGPFGSNIKVSTFVPEGVPIISGNHLRGYFLEESEFNYITEEHAERLKNSIVFPHDLIFTHAGNIGQVAMIPDGCKYDCYVLSQRQFYLRCDETKVVPEFLLMFFHSASGQHELLSYANQTGVPSIAQPASNLKKIPFKCPPMQEQLMWQEQVHPLLGRYLNNRLENDKLSTLRDTLLPRLMSGELDVFGLDL